MWGIGSKASFQGSIRGSCEGSKGILGFCLGCWGVGFWDVEVLELDLRGCCYIGVSEALIWV